MLLLLLLVLFIHIFTHIKVLAAETLLSHCSDGVILRNSVYYPGITLMAFVIVLSCYFKILSAEKRL